MDSQHRHELEENDLATWLEREVRALKPHLPAILLGLFAVVGATLGWSAWSQSAAHQKAEAWSDFTHAFEGRQISLSALKQAAEENPGSSIEEWSTVTWADGQLWNASNLYIQDRAKSDEALAEAEEAYQKLTNASSGAIIGRANYGLGRILEMRGELEKAIAQYKKVNGMFAEIASERAESLSSPKVAEGYAWITQVKAVAPSNTTGPLGLEADDIAMPAEEEIDTEATLNDILSQTIDPSESEADDRYEEEATDADAEVETEETVEEAISDVQENAGE